MWGGDLPAHAVAISLRPCCGAVSRERRATSCTRREGTAVQFDHWYILRTPEQGANSMKQRLRRRTAIGTAVLMAVPGSGPRGGLPCLSREDRLRGLADLSGHVMISTGGGGFAMTDVEVGNANMGCPAEAADPVVPVP